MVAFAILLGSASSASAATIGTVVTDPPIVITDPPVGTVPSLGKLQLKATDELKGFAVADAVIVVWDAKGRKVASQVTNADGKTTIELVQGLYKVRVYASGYEVYGQTVKIAAGQATTLEAALKPLANDSIVGK